MRLENKVAFVSGGARGMGAAEARLFAQEGPKSSGDVLDDEATRPRGPSTSLAEMSYVHLDVKSEDSWAFLSPKREPLRKVGYPSQQAGVVPFPC
ncbi:MAG: hypothetical protein Ct9H300mP11_20170 [Chloroflexota bacterium]|nr:MAG: hypothetical protein Ct9H300mP11_20170 [Chloroflexota bacterium]